MPTQASLKSLVLVMALVICLGVAYLVGATANAAQPAAASTTAAVAATTTAKPGTMTMTGVGQVLGVPDQMKFTVAVTRTAADVSNALDLTSATMRRIYAALRRSGVERKDTQTADLSIDPVYRYYRNSPPVITGYRVRQSVDVVVRTLKNSGTAIAAAIHAGGNAVRVNGLTLQIGNRDALLKKARDAAIADATAKAKEYAQAAGQTLGSVMKLQEVRTAAPTPRAFSSGVKGGYDSVQALASVPVRSGRQQISVTVNVVWALQ